MLFAPLLLLSALAAPYDSPAMLRSDHPIRPAPASSLARSKHSTHRVVIVSLHEQAHHKSRAQLAKILPGATIGGYVPHDSFAVLASPHHVAQAQSHPSVAFVGAFDPEHKISPALLLETGRHPRRVARALVRLWTLAMRVPSMSLEALLKQWCSTGGVLERFAAAIRAEPEGQGFELTLPPGNVETEQILRSLSALETVKQFLRHVVR